MSKGFRAAVLVTAGIKCLFFILDPLPQFYGGDSISYLNTKIGTWIPLDRSFSYGLLIRFIEAFTHSLTPLILLQTALSFAAVLLLYYCAKQVLGLSTGMSLAIAALFAADPIQILYERQVMAETISTFHLVVALTLSLSYLGRPRVWKCLLIPIFCVLSTAFRVNSYPLSWFLCLMVPLFVFLREIYRNRWGKDAARLAGYSALSILCFVLVLSAYADCYGWLTNREPAVTYTQGFFMLSGLWNVVIPEDAPDPRLATIIAGRRVFLPGKNPALERNVQRFGNEGLILRWESITIPGSVSYHDEVAKQTAWNAIKRAPAEVLHATVSNYREYFVDMESHIYDIYERFTPMSNRDIRWLKEHFDLTVTSDWKDRSTATKRYLLQFRWWCYILLLSPLLGIIAAGFCWKSGRFVYLALLAVSGFLAFLPGCVFVVTNVRLLHPLSFGTFLILGVIAESLRKTILRKEKEPS